MNPRITASRLVLASFASLLTVAPRAALAEDEPASARAAVFTSTNGAAANEIVAFSRGADGALAPAGHFATGGKGTGSGLGSQGALALAGDLLFAVNAGTNDISTFSLASGAPVLVSRAPSGGTTPISLTVRDDLLYVLNAGGAASVSGFWFDRGGALHPIAGSTQPVNGAGAVQVGLDPSGDTLVVAEKVANQIETYAIDGRGRAAPPVSHASNGQTPFGFDFTPRGDLVISEAFGGLSGKAAVSSYALGRHAGLASISASVPDGQTAACWLVAGERGRYAFTANAGSGDVSAYTIDRRGELALVGTGVAATTGDGSHPIDLALSRHDRFLYALASGTGAILGFAVDGGSLAPVNQVEALPPSVSGLVAR